VALIRVEREAGPWADRMREYEIVIDGSSAGTLGAGQRCEFAVSAGDHEIRARSDWGASVSVRASLSEADELTLVCRPALSNTDLWRPWRVVRAVTGDRDERIRLELAPR